MRVNSRICGVLALVTVFCSVLIHGQGKSEDSAKGSLLLTPYRGLAGVAFKAFESGNSEEAAVAARSLEKSWDEGAGTIEVISPTTWEAIDHAMDVFIGPLKVYDDNAQSREKVRVSYMAYLRELDNARSLRWPKDNSLNPIRTSSGVVCVVIKEGSGRQPQPGEIVILRVVGFANGKEFRRTKEEATPDWWWLLPDRQPLGVIEGMGLLHIGDSAILMIPPGLGYGPKGGLKGKVPPSAQLTYVVDVLDVKSKEILSLLTETIESRGIDAAVEQYRKLQQRGFPDVYVDEAQMNGVGYTLLKNKNSEGAIEIFKLNVQTYPASANAYDSLGEAYAANGQREMAIESYQKALSINPTMESSINALRKLQGN